MHSAEANPRQEAMAVLSHAAPRRLAELWSAWADKPAFHKVRGPETGLVMVRARAGGGGNPFNLGEATVTRATIRLETGEVGHAYCLGRDGELGVLAPGTPADLVCWPMEGVAFAGALSDPVEAWLRCGPVAAHHTVVHGRVLVEDRELTVGGVEEMLARHREISASIQGA